jgi:hypothetical protein
MSRNARQARRPSASGPGDCGLSPWCRHRFIREGGRSARRPPSCQRPPEPRFHGRRRRTRRYRVPRPALRPRAWRLRPYDSGARVLGHLGRRRARPEPSFGFHLTSLSDVRGAPYAASRPWPGWLRGCRRCVPCHRPGWSQLEGRRLRRTLINLREEQQNHAWPADTTPCL